jgi:glyceraldehyde 3-phosphate dehydrogenase
MAQICDAVCAAAATPEMRGVIVSTRGDQCVSSDFIGDSHSCVYDSAASILLNTPDCAGGSMVKLVAFYDNEYAYACRMVDLMIYMKQQS